MQTIKYFYVKLKPLGSQFVLYKKNEIEIYLVII